MTTTSRAQARLPPEVNRSLYIRNLPFNITPEELFDIFGKFGAVREIRLGTSKTTRGTAYVTYEDIYDAKLACEKLSGFNISNRYLIVLYYQSAKSSGRNLANMEREVETLKREHGVSSRQ